MKLNLTQIGREENILHEIAHLKDKPKYEEAIIDGDLPPIEQNPPPDWLPMSEKKPWWKIFRLLLV